MLKNRQKILLEVLWKDLPKEFTDYIKYTRILKLEENPDYDYLRDLFKNNLINTYNYSKFNLFWIIKMITQVKNLLTHK